MADDRVNFLIQARDQATATLNKVNRELKTMGGTAGAAAGPLGKLSAVTGGLINPATLVAGAVLGVGAALVTAAKAAMDEETGIKKLSTALAQNAGDYSGNTDAIEATIAAREKLGFADDEQRDSLAQLVAITRDSSKALDLQRQAMDLARLKGIDLSTASNIIGKVYGGNLGILARYGIQLDKGATSTSALAEIQRRAAGQAEAYGETTQGAMESAGIALQDATEDIGAMLLPVLRDLAVFARDQLIPAIRDIAGVFGTVGGAIGDLVGDVDEAVNDIALNFGDMGTRVHAIADEAKVDFQEVKDFVRERMRETGESFAEASAAADEHFGTITASTEELVARSGTAWDTYQSQIHAANEGAATDVRGFQDSIVAKMEEGRVRVVDVALRLPGDIADALREGRDAVKQGWESLRDAQDEVMDPAAERALLQGQLVSAELAAGLNDNRPEVRAEAERLQQAIYDRLAAINGYSAGMAIPLAMARGIYDGSWNAEAAARRLAAGVSGMLPSSEPKNPTSPLRGITRVGGNIARMIASDLLRNVGVAERAAGVLAEALAPGAVVDGGGVALLPPRAGMGVAGGGGGGLTVVFQSSFPPTPEQAAGIARAILPELTREQRRQGLS